MAKTATTPRELEAQILVKAATKFQHIVNDWDNEKSKLREALRYNQKLWIIFIANATDPESNLPEALRNNITNLGVFVLKRTQELMLDPKPEGLDILMSINRELSIGLRS